MLFCENTYIQYILDIEVTTQKQKQFNKRLSTEL